MMRLDGWKRVCAIFLFCTTAIVSRAQTFTTLLSFDGKDGEYPHASLVQGVDGNFYGTTQGGGRDRLGTTFGVTPSGELTGHSSFCTLAECADGDDPIAPLLLASNGKFYGTTEQGGTSGPNGYGTVFEATAFGTVTTLHSFEGIDGDGPGGLAEAANGNFYGTTSNGGLNGFGVVFEITASGAFTTLYNFCSLPNCTDGRNPLASLIQGTDGNLFGTTFLGGTNQNAKYCPFGCGTVFKISTTGRLSTLYNFCSRPNCADGYTPYASLIQATDGNLYGTTSGGGTNNGGTIFKITPTSLTTLYSFCSLPNCTDGNSPYASLIQAADGNFYGTTLQGGRAGYGTIFEITPTGTLTVLYSFCSVDKCADGSYADGSLLQATNGTFYGTTEQGGVHGDGSVFSLATGLGPFVSFVRNPAKVGQEFGILGQGFTGTTSVSLNGTPASFIVKAETLIEATVPAGAATGYVAVTTPTGTLTSNVTFYVLP